MAKFIKQSERLTMRKKTNGGELCKVRLSVFGHDKSDAALFIDKLILSSDENYINFARPLREYKGKTLWYQQMGIKLTTLNEIGDWLNTLDLENEFK